MTLLETQGEVTEKTGELFVAVDAADWRNHITTVTEERMKTTPSQVQSASKRITSSPLAQP
jgi:hypothetical protein